MCLVFTFKLNMGTVPVTCRGGAADKSTCPIQVFQIFSI